MWSELGNEPRSAASIRRPAAALPRPIARHFAAALVRPASRPAPAPSPGTQSEMRAAAAFAPPCRSRPPRAQIAQQSGQRPRPRPLPSAPAPASPTRMRVPHTPLLTCGFVSQIPKRRPLGLPAEPQVPPVHTNANSPGTSRFASPQPGHTPHSPAWPSPAGSPPAPAHLLPARSCPTTSHCAGTTARTPASALLPAHMPPSMDASPPRRPCCPRKSKARATAATPPHSAR